MKSTTKWFIIYASIFLIFELIGLILFTYFRPLLIEARGNELKGGEYCFFLFGPFAMAYASIIIDKIRDRKEDKHYE
ncbi:MAG: hypothetical protein ACI4OB_06800 [Christensenellales bacterium]